MTPLYLLLLLPALAIIGWAVYVKISDHRYVEALLIAMPALAVLVNAVLVQHMMQYGESLSVRWWSMFLVTTIVPFTYMYFARQLGRPWANITTGLLWILLVNLTFPNSIVYLGGEPFLLDSTVVHPWSLHLVHGGQIVGTMLLGDCVVIMQVVLVMLRMVPLWRTMRRLHLRFTYKTYIFVAWWVAAGAFLLAASTMNLQQLATVGGSLFYFSATSLLLITVYLLAATRFNLRPVDEEGTVVTNVERLEVAANLREEQHALSEQVRRLMETERLYLDSGFSTMDMASRLGLNRTYFSRMMQVEFGMTFSDYLQDLRLRHAQQLLLTTDYKQEEIAELSGFNDAPHMARIFKSVLDTTPGAWKKTNRENI